jgi:hypothetical protein
MKMKQPLFFVLAMALTPICAFAVDGVVLINQSTVMAAGGFPYTISQPGSYRLSGNLVIPGNTNGIQIAASGVTLDLNGFNIQCSVTLPNQVSCIIIESTAHTATIRNGSITGTLLGGPMGSINNLVGVYAVAGLSSIENLKIDFPASVPPVFGSFRTIIAAGGTRISQNTLIGGGFVNCPSVIIENAATGSMGQSTFDFGYSGCSGFGNVGLPTLP